MLQGGRKALCLPCRRRMDTLTRKPSLSFNYELAVPDEEWLQIVQATRAG